MDLGILYRITATIKKKYHKEYTQNSSCISLENKIFCKISFSSCCYEGLKMEKNFIH